MKRLSLLLLLLLFLTNTYSQIKDRTNLTKSDISLSVIGLDFQKISIKEGSPMADIGKPELPMYIYSYVIPAQANNVKVVIDELSAFQLEGNIIVYPAQPQIPLNGIDDLNRPFIMDSAFYKSDTEYPTEKIKLVRDYTELGYRIVDIAIYPVSYVPSKKEVTIRNFKFTIHYNIGKPESTITKCSDNRLNACKEYISFKVRNPEHIQNRAPLLSKVFNEPSNNFHYMPAEEIIPDYIIVTSEKLKPAFEKLASWKTQKGVPTIIKTTESIFANYDGNDKQEKIRNYIIECYKKWGAGLFVLLGGNATIIPTRIYNNFGTDLYYATTSGNWYNNTQFTPSSEGFNINLGRAPVSKPDEVDNFVSKVISYEKGEALDKSYVNNFLAALAFLDRKGCYNSAPENEIRYTSSISDYHTINKNHLNQTLPANIKSNTTLMVDNAKRNMSNSSYTNQAVICDNTPAGYPKVLIPVRTPNLAPGGDVELSKFNFTEHLSNKKPHIIYHLDHSYVKGIGLSSKDKGEALNSEDVNYLNNGNHYQIIFSGGCKTTSIQYDDCIAASFINATKKGAVAFLGNSNDGYYSEFIDLKPFTNIIYNNPNKTNMSFIHRHILSYKSISKHRLTLFGDPEMPVWTKTPGVLNINTEISKSPDKNESILSLTLNNNLSGTAFICLSKGSDLYITSTIEENKEYRFFIPDLSPEKLTLTITAKDYIPYIKEFDLFASSQIPRFQIKNYTVSDDETGETSGNANKLIEAGETVDLMPEIENTGNKEYGLMKLVASSNSTLISITDSVCYFDSETIKSAKLRLKVNKRAGTILKSDINNIKIRFRFTDERGFLSECIIPIEIRSSIISQGNKSVAMENNRIKIGVEIKNTGLGSESALKARLIVTDPDPNYIGESTTSTYRELVPNSSSYNLNSFIYECKAPVTYENFPTKYKLILSNKYGKEDTLTFNLSDKTTNNILNVQFANKDNEIGLSWASIKHPGLLGYNIYKSYELNGLFTKVNNQYIKYPYYVDYEVNPLTEYYYKIASVNADGNEMNLSQAFKTATSLKPKDLFPVNYDNTYGDRPLPISLYDIDNDGRMEIFTGISGSDGSKKSMLIGLNNDGTELFDIDHNVTSYSGFSILNKAKRSGLSIGDINGTETTEIISLTRDYSSADDLLTVFSTVNDGNNKPAIIWEKNILKENQANYYFEPIIANIDNSMDRSMEVITFSDNTGTLTIRNNDGSIRWEKEVTHTSGIWPLCRIAVGAFENTGFKHIVVGTDLGVSVYNYKGELLKSEHTKTSNNLVTFSKAGHSFSSSAPVICDINNDGKKEIIIISHSQSGTNKTSTVFIMNEYGEELPNWGVQTFPFTDWNTGVSVSRLFGNNDIYLLVSAKDRISVWDNNGKLFVSKEVANIDYMSPPLTGDIDGDEIKDILYTCNNKIYAINPYGNLVNGFPIELKGTKNKIALSDLEQNGKTDLIANSEGKIYTWESNGYSENLDWGQERYNPQFTGEYLFTSDIPQTENATKYNSINKIIDIIPNPVSAESVVRLSINGYCKNIDLIVTGVSGQNVLTIKDIKPQQNKIKISKSDLNSGYYIISLFIDGIKSNSKSFIVK